MKRIKVNLIIASLSLALAILSGFTYSKYHSSKRNQRQIRQVQQTKDINLINIESLVKKLNNENSLLVLSGEINIQATYSNKEISEDDVDFKWLKDWFSDMNSKDLIVDSVYSFQFYYDLKDMNIQLIANQPTINLDKDRLSCQVELIETKSIYNERIGFLEVQFTPQEINSINARTKELVLNKVQSNKELRDKAIHNTKQNINDILNTEIIYTTSNFDVVEQDNNIVIK